MTRAASIRHLILGLLAPQPMSGYDIKCLLESWSWLVDSPSFGSLYPTLHALQNDGLVTVERVPGQGKPARKVYTITEVGTQALREWVDQPVAQDTSLKTFIMRLILASSFSHTGLIAYLQQRRSQVAVRRATLEQIAGTPDEMEDLGQRLASGYGLALASAELVWLDSALKHLSQQSLPVEVVRNASVPLAV